MYTNCRKMLQRKIKELRIYMQLLSVVFFINCSANCLDRILIYEDDRMMDDICHSSLEGAQSRFQYHLEGSRIQVVYFTARGQYQSRPDRGFWLSFRQIRGTSVN